MTPPRTEPATAVIITEPVFPLKAEYTVPVAIPKQSVSNIHT